MEVLIEYDEEDEMLSVSSKGESVFYGNYHDFDDSPKGLARFLKDLGARVYIKKTKFTSEDYEDNYNDD